MYAARRTQRMQTPLSSCCYLAVAWHRTEAPRRASRQVRLRSEVSRWESLLRAAALTENPKKTPPPQKLLVVPFDSPEALLRACPPDRERDFERVCAAEAKKLPRKAAAGTHAPRRPVPSPARTAAAATAAVTKAAAQHPPPAAAATSRACALQGRDAAEAAGRGSGRSGAAASREVRSDGGGASPTSTQPATPPNEASEAAEDVVPTPSSEQAERLGAPPAAAWFSKPLHAGRAARVH
eukprot:Rhum_TRINITY_DN13736_c1_g1::Rhum_TRINITY_DN13736_c1_g1_i1::g.63539::m.63539